MPFRGPSSQPRSPTPDRAAPVAQAAPPPATPLAVPAGPPPIFATTPEGTVPVQALAEARRRQAQPTALMLVGIAAGCLVAGILVTMLVLRLFG
jgi:serine/threonine-protein kinase